MAGAPSRRNLDCRPGDAPSSSPSILAMLETLQNAAHLEVHKDMILWILQTLSAIKKIRESSSTSPVVEIEGSVLEEVCLSITH
ncbi:hypothetical protein FKM82_025825 [Ascaphus truei]